MFRFWQSKKAPRKFIDLLWRSSDKFAVWDPACAEIAIGDYGTLDKETGRFQTEGNIFTTPEFKDLVNDHRPGLGPQKDRSDDIIVVTSEDAKRTEVNAAVGLNAQVAQATFKGGWTFGEHTGAVLVAHKPRHEILPVGLKLEEISTRPSLDGKLLITNVTKCPAYALYLASKEDSGISLALCLQVPPGAVSAGAELTTNWVWDHGGGLFRSGFKDEPSYTVLFDLKRCRKKAEGWFRDSPSPVFEGVDSLDDAVPPWNLLDDDGEEKKV